MRITATLNFITSDMPQLSCNCDIEFHDNCGYAYYCGYELSKNVT